MSLAYSCSVCGARSELYCCGACLTSVYCGAECQARDWRAGHPAFCLIAGKRKRETTLAEFPREIVFEIVQYLSAEKLKQFLEANDFFANRPSVMAYIYAHYVYKVDSSKNLPAWVYNFRNIRYDGIDEDSLVEITHRFPFIETIYISIEIITELILKSLLKLPHLKQVKYEYDELWFRGIEFDKPMAELAAQIIKNSTNIKVIDFGKSTNDAIEIDSQYLHIITDALKFTNVTSFGYFNIFLSDNDIYMIAEMLTKNTNLRELYIGSDDYPSITSNAIQALFTVLKSKKNALNIYLNNIGLDDEAYRVLFDMLKYNTTIHTFNIEYIDIPTNGMNAIADMLKHNTTLLYLTIACFEHDEVDILANALLQNTTLRALSTCADTLNNEDMDILRNAAQQGNITLDFY